MRRVKKSAFIPPSFSLPSPLASTRRVGATSRVHLRFELALRLCVQKFTSIRVKPLFAGHGHHDGAVARFDVAFQMEDLLPGAQHRFPAGHRHGQ